MSDEVAPQVSPDTLLLYATLPQFVQDADAETGFPLLSWLEGPGSLLQAIDELCRDQGSTPGWSILLDITRCPTAGLPWLGQFVGTRLTATQLQSDGASRQAIETPTGWGRGSLAAIQAAAAPLMIPGFMLTILERTPDPYSLTIDVPNAGLFGGTWGELDEAYATYALRDAAFATYGAELQVVTSIVQAVTAAIPAGLILTIAFV